MGNLQIQESDRDGCPLLSLEGQLDKEKSPELKVRLEALVRTGCPTVFLDLSRMSVVDSVGLGVLIFYHSYLKADGRELVLLDPQGEILNLLEISCLDRVLKIRRS